MNGQHEGDHVSDRADPERERLEADQNRDHQREASGGFHPGNHGFQDDGPDRAATSRQSPAGPGQRYGQSYSAHGYYQHTGPRFEQGDARYEDGARSGQRDWEPRQHERQSFEQPGYGYEAGRWNRGDSAPGQYERDAQFAPHPVHPGHAPQHYDHHAEWSPQHGSAQDSYREARDPYRGGRGESDPRTRLPERLPHDSRARRRYPPGPKGYQRSDARLCEDISERLMQAYHIDSSEVTVEVQGGKVILEGTVPDRYMKHAIEDLADAAPGVQDIENRIRVARHPVARDTLAESAKALGSAPLEDQTSERPSGFNTASASGSSGSAGSTAPPATANVPGSSGADSVGGAASRPSGTD